MEHDDNYKKPIALSWSGGKDCAYALHQLKIKNEYEVTCLLSTFSSEYRRLSMHGVKEELIEAQADSLGLPLLKVVLQDNSYETYEKQMSAALQQLKDQNIYTIAFGDILLEDLRRYREEKNNVAGIQSIFPLWGMSTNMLPYDFIRKGFKAITCCVSDEHLNETFCGRVIDKNFLQSLPPGVDLCGENGEYHSFCFDGPIFKRKINFNKSETIYRSPDVNTAATIDTKGFWYTDLKLV